MKFLKCKYTSTCTSAVLKMYLSKHFTVEATAAVIINSGAKHINVLCLHVQLHLINFSLCYYTNPPSTQALIGHSQLPQQWSLH